MTKINRENYNIAEAIREALVADGETVATAELMRADGNADEQLVVLELTYEDGDAITVSFYVYFDGTWFSPMDWHGYQVEKRCEVPEIDWQLGVTGREAVILGGAPRMIFGE